MSRVQILSASRQYSARRAAGPPFHKIEQIGSLEPGTGSKVNSRNHRRHRPVRNCTLATFPITHPRSNESAVYKAEFEK